MIGYVAKDKDGEVYLYDDCPVYKEKYDCWFASPDMINITNKYPEFDNMSYTDEPIKVKIKLEKI